MNATTEQESGVHIFPAKNVFVCLNRSKRSVLTMVLKTCFLNVSSINLEWYDPSVQRESSYIQKGILCYYLMLFIYAIIKIFSSTFISLPTKRFL